MPSKDLSNTLYEKVSLIDEDDDETKKWIKKKPVDEIDINGKNICQYRKDVMVAGEHTDLPETKIQLYPELFTKSSTNISDDPTKYPKEKKKTFAAFLIIVFSFLINSISIVLTHQKVPDRSLHPPLPDIILDNITKRRWLNDVADILVIVGIILSALIVLLHRHRWILCRRVFLILSALYCLRSATIYVTVLPLANDHVYCSPKINESLSYGQMVLTVTKEVLRLIHSGGLPITGKKTLCGDYIFSGHTIILMISYLLVREYIPKRYSMLHWCSWITPWIGMICLLISHGHYTIDVLIGYYATTRMFWIYHTFCNNPELKRDRDRTSETHDFHLTSSKVNFDKISQQTELQQMEISQFFDVDMNVKQEVFEENNDLEQKVVNRNHLHVEVAMEQFVTEMLNLQNTKKIDSVQHQYAVRTSNKIKSDDTAVVTHVFDVQNPERKSSTNALSDVWWFPVLQYFEANVSGKLPKQYSTLRLRRKVHYKNTL